jgi:CheY-like chemotaxis protein
MSDKIVPSRPTALLVDDHPDVLVGIGAFLNAAGYDVVRAPSGDEALACLSSGQRFALLVTDYAMPGLNGVDLVRQALEQFPDLKALIITGFPSDAGLFARPANVALLATVPPGGTYGGIAIIGSRRTADSVRIPRPSQLARAACL